MARLPRIGDWPFTADEEVSLLWLRSPYRSPRGRQWRLGTCFRSTDGTFHELDMPWGALPQLSLGKTYVDGYVIDEHSAQGSCIEFGVPPGVLPVIRPAHEVLPLDVLVDMVGNGSDEKCLVFQLSNQRIILPALEVIRTLLCPNRSLASGLLEPEYLSRVIAANEIKNDVLNLRFTKEVAVATLNQAVARRFSRLLYDDSFRQCWEAVERERYHVVGTARSGRRVPLACPLPKLNGRWTVRALPIGVAGTWLVLEIVAVTAATSLPFKQVRFTHPELTSTSKDDELIGKDDGGSSKNNGDLPGDSSKRVKKDTRSKRRLSIDRSHHAPRNSRQPRRVGVIVSGLLGDQQIKVVKQAERTRTHRRQEERLGSENSASGGNSDPVDPKMTAEQPKPATPISERTCGGTATKLLPGEAVFSVSSAAREARNHAGEYKVVEASSEMLGKPLELHPLPLVCKPHEGLDRLSDTLGHLAIARPDWIVEWSLATLMANIPYANMGSQKRQYALIRYAGGANVQQPACWMLEFARLDRCAPSTLLFFPSTNSGEGVSESDVEMCRRVPFLVQEILAVSLKEKGWWDWSELMRFHDAGRMHFDLLSHHFSGTALKWAKRLEKRIHEARQAMTKS